MEEHTIIFYCHVHGLDKVLDYARCFHSVVSQYRMPRCSKKQNKGGGTTRKFEAFSLMCLYLLFRFLKDFGDA